MNDNDFLQHYLGELNTQAQNNAVPSVPATDQSGQSEHSSHGHRAGLEQQAKPQQQSGTGEQTRDPDGQSTSEDSEAAASPQVKEGAHQDTGNSDHKPGKHAAKLRSQDLQEKNRKAQRRFRERQKAKVSELEQKVAEQQRAMTVLLQDKANLESRVNIFVRVLQMRDEQIEQIRSGQRILATKDKDEVAESFKDDLTLTVREGQPLILTPAQVKNMTLEDMVSIWKEYVNELAQALVDTDKNSQDAVAAEKIKRLVNEATILCMRVAISNPVITKSFVACQLEDNSFVAGEEPPEMWLAVARSLLLSPEQRAELIQLRRLFISKLSSIIDQRKEIHALLTGSVPSAIGSRHTAIRYLQSHDCIDKLKRNMREEHVLKLDWISTLFKHLLTPVQVARCMVQGWPYTPDTLAICSWVAAEDGDAGALAVLTASSRTVAPSKPSWGGVSTQASFPGTDTRNSFTAAAAENRNGFPSGASRGSFDVGDIRGRRGSTILPSSLPGQASDTHLAGLPLSGPLAGSSDTPFDLGPSGSNQHPAGHQAWLPE